MTKTDKAKLAAGAADIRKAEKGAKPAKTAAVASKPSAGTMEIHPVAKMFPMLPAKEMRELKADIEAHGIKVPLLVSKDKRTIIDGRNRYMIAMDLGITEIPTEPFKGTEEEIPGEVLSRNVFRRHLNNDQRVSLVTKIRAPQLEKEAKERKATKGTFGAPASADGKKGSVAEHIAKEADVSVHKAEQAVKALKSGQIGDVIEKKKSLKEAAKTVPAKKRKVKAEPTLEEIVLSKWDRFIKSFAPQQRAQVKIIVRGFLIEAK